MIRIQNILVATDFSDISDAALTYALEMARTFHASLDLLHVVDEANVQDGDEYRAIALAELQEGIGAAAWSRIERRSGGGLDVPIAAAVRASADKAAAIVEYAVQNGTNLIVLGTHGCRAAIHLFMGSVAERVVRTAPCPVLLFGHPERHFIAHDETIALAHA
jgi:nucleotide-binding universal stress UspA family protein